MLAGHVGAALVIGRAERRVPVGVFVTAALLLDLALWIFVLVGWESATIPKTLAVTHQPEFEFPFSHGLVAAALWSAAAGALAFAAYTRRPAVRRRAAILVAAAVFSHWLLDALVHQPQLPLGGAGSPKVGLGLSLGLPGALAVETAIVVAGLCAFLRGSTLPRRRSVALAALSVVTLVFTWIGMTIAPPPPSSLAMAGGSLLTLAVVCSLACWIGGSVSAGSAE